MLHRRLRLGRRLGGSFAHRLLRRHGSRRGARGCRLHLSRWLFRASRGGGACAVLATAEWSGWSEWLARVRVGVRVGVREPVRWIARSEVDSAERGRRWIVRSEVDNAEGG
eukprot:scaffold31189_cov58-Phaeocystis_antarctica.AAC.5